MQDTKGKASDRENPNVIIIYADDLWYDDLQCCGRKNVETPNANRLASDGIRFTNAHAVAALLLSHGILYLRENMHSVVRIQILLLVMQG